MKANEKICIALDVDNASDAINLAKSLKDYVGMFKIGLQLYSSEGPDVVRKIKDVGGNIFLDLKYHDIPNTVANAARVITGLGISMFNIHACGGYEMMAATAEAVDNEAERLHIKKPLILGVTILTSINSKILKEDLNINVALENQVVHFAQMAKRAGLDGVVASPKETLLIREAMGRDFIIVTPGIRPSWSVGRDDQKRVTTPREAVEKGSNYIVIGRPIIAAQDPVAAAQKVVHELNS